MVNKFIYFYLLLINSLGRKFRITVISGTFIYEFKYNATLNNLKKGIMKSSSMASLNNNQFSKYDYITLIRKNFIEEIEYFLITSDYSKFMIKLQTSKNKLFNNIYKFFILS